ncbi:hypothetical protein Pcinc_020107 [Petrolisthes cinctipes]|uniref:Uncharacterized protein n=1 Tax=Petrolisthes cinctipes TaxID=88211 RepID=A0AAE1FIT5_PETCI|nr:hypothetical protein Pcinc_020107 [Petrolisthes cinctipes]
MSSGDLDNGGVWCSKPSTQPTLTFSLCRHPAHPDILPLPSPSPPRHSPSAVTQPTQTFSLSSHPAHPDILLLS